MITRIFGIDFTSTPGNRKPITVAEAKLLQQTLKVDNIFDLESLGQFSQFLETPGPWITAIDFPFGQPRKLILDYGWPRLWQSYVNHISLMGKQNFENSLRNYRDVATGKRRLQRETDKKANSRSPMQLDFTPVGKMFYVGAPLLARSPCTIIPFRKEHGKAGIVVEGYPKLVAMKAVGKTAYKNDSTFQTDPDQTKVRNSILQWIHGDEAKEQYGFTMELNSASTAKCLNDPKGDHLDAALCVMQAAWALGQRHKQYGIPNYCDQLEGWIVDPEMLKSY